VNHDHEEFAVADCWLQVKGRRCGWVGAVAGLIGIVSLDAAMANDPRGSALDAGGEAARGMICVLDETLAAGPSRAWAERLTAAVGDAQVDAAYDSVFKGFSFRASVSVDEHRVRLHAPVRYCEPNGLVYVVDIVQSDQQASAVSLTTKWRSGTSGQIVPVGVVRVGGPQDGGGRHAWIVDTGIDLRHRDLVIGAGANFVRDARGRISGTPNDGNGHGTHVAGIVAAVNNRQDVVGVAAGATVHPVRVLDNQGSGTVDGVIAGLDFVAANAQPGDVINLSLGAAGHFQSLHDAVLALADRGIKVSIAAGNAGALAQDYEPAHVEHPNVYTVSAVDSGDRFAAFSNYGNPPIDWAAPGVDIVSLRVGGGTVVYSGTSMAAPHVAGILLLSTPREDGQAVGDPDSVADPIGHY